jgi:hypothetical protein
MIVSPPLAVQAWRRLVLCEAMIAGLGRKSEAAVSKKQRPARGGRGILKSASPHSDRPFLKPALVGLERRENLLLLGQERFFNHLRHAWQLEELVEVEQLGTIEEEFLLLPATEEKVQFAAAVVPHGKVRRHRVVVDLLW